MSKVQIIGKAPGLSASSRIELLIDGKKPEGVRSFALLAEADSVLILRIEQYPTDEVLVEVDAEVKAVCPCCKRELPSDEDSELSRAYALIEKNRRKHPPIPLPKEDNQ